MIFTKNTKEYFLCFLITICIVTFSIGCGSESNVKKTVNKKSSSPDLSVMNDIYEMVHVSGGTFKMGDRDRTGDPNERPVHEVTLNDFYIGKDEVTIDLYTQFCDEVGDHLPQFKNKFEMKEKRVPESIYKYRIEKHKSICGVDWYDSVAFCNWLSKKLKLRPCYKINFSNVTCDFSANGFRLPTEAEWEYVARGGRRESEQDKMKKKPDGVIPNAFGLLKLHSDLGEWCWDLYDMDYYKHSPNASPTGGKDKFANRVVRGRNWGDTKMSSFYYEPGTKSRELSLKWRPCWRNFQSPKDKNARLGFRMARNGRQEIIIK